jgi:hypothetical protein
MRPLRRIRHHPDAPPRPNTNLVAPITPTLRPVYPVRRANSPTPSPPSTDTESRRKPAPRRRPSGAEARRVDRLQGQPTVGSPSKVHAQRAVGQPLRIFAVPGLRRCQSAAPIATTANSALALPGFRGENVTPAACLPAMKRAVRVDDLPESRERENDWHRDQSEE